MSNAAGFLSGIAFSALAAGAGVGAWVLLAPKPAEKAEAKPGPAAITSPFKEEQAATVTLTPDALRVTAVETAKVVRKALPRFRTYGGEVMIAAGHTALASAPLPGTVLAPAGGMPVPGQAVTKGQALLRLVPLLAPEARATLAAAAVDADGQVKTAFATREASRIALERAEKLFKSEAGSQRAVDDAKERFEVAEKGHAAAVARRKLLTDVLGDAGKGDARPLVIEAPEDGTLRALSVLPGQVVPAGAALFEVVDLARVWVRVPVYAGEMDEIARDGPAHIKALSAPSKGPGVSAPPAAAPPSANAIAGTIDLYYALDNRATKHGPGHRVAAVLPLKGEAESLAVPRAAVLYDYHGGAWVYERVNERTFARKRVVVRYTAGEMVALASGPPPGTEVVTAGPAELFGADAGFTK